MHQLKVFVLCFVCVICVFGSNIRNGRDSQDKKKNANSVDVMTQCNESFPIKPELLNDLNTTGSFSDESEKIPMCYIHCFLTKMGAMGEESQIITEVVTNMYEIEDEEMVADCINEMVATSINDPCGKAYFFLRCLMTRTLIDNKGSAHEEAVK